VQVRPQEVVNDNHQILQLLPRAEANPPQLVGKWKFTEDSPPIFVSKVPVLSGVVLHLQQQSPQRQMMGGVPLDVADSKAADATHGALDWQQRVVQYYKREMAAGRIKEMPPLPSAAGKHTKEDYNAFFSGWKPDLEARKALEDVSFV